MELGKAKQFGVDADTIAEYCGSHSLIARKSDRALARAAYCDSSERALRWCPLPTAHAHARSLARSQLDGLMGKREPGLAAWAVND